MPLLHLLLYTAQQISILVSLITNNLYLPLGNQINECLSYTETRPNILSFNYLVVDKMQDGALSHSSLFHLAKGPAIRNFIAENRTNGNV